MINRQDEQLVLFDCDHDHDDFDVICPICGALLTLPKPKSTLSALPPSRRPND